MFATAFGAALSAAVSLLCFRKIRQVNLAARGLGELLYKSKGVRINGRAGWDLAG